MIILPSLALLTAVFPGVLQQPITHKRLRIPGTAHGFVGGESQEVFQFFAPRSGTVTAIVKYRIQNDDHAVDPKNTSFQIDGAKIVKETKQQVVMILKVRKGHTYPFTSTAYPVAKYTLSLKYRK